MKALAPVPFDVWLREQQDLIDRGEDPLDDHLEQQADNRRAPRPSARPHARTEPAMSNTTDQPPVDATIVEDEPSTVIDFPRPRGADTASLAVHERRSEVIRPLDPDALVDAFAAYQDLLPKLLLNEDYQAAGTDKKTGKPRRFVKKSGWRKIAAAFDLDVVILRSTVDRDINGTPERAEVWARAISPSGRAMDGDGYCDASEDRFNRDGRKKLENDLRTTATTRAMNRAISGLVGMGDIDNSTDTDDAPAGPVEASEDLRAATREQLAYLLGGDFTAGDQLFEYLVNYFDDRLPAHAGQAIVLVGRAIKQHRERYPDGPTE